MKSLFFACFFFSALAASAQTLKSIDVYSSFDAPGYNEIDASGVKTGFEIELTDAIFQSQGMRVNWLERSWTDIVEDLAKPSFDKQYIYVASIESREERRANWMFTLGVEYNASHYFYSKDLPLVAGTVTDTDTGKSIPNFILDVAANQVNGKKLRIATWQGSVFEKELQRVFPHPKYVEIVGMTAGQPTDWLAAGQADVVYIYASGPKNAYADAKYLLVGGPINNFDLDRFGGSSPAVPLNSFGQKAHRLWLEGFAAILRDDTFFKISMKWFGRVSWPAEFNGFLIQDPAAFEERIRIFESKRKENQ